MWGIIAYTFERRSLSAGVISCLALTISPWISIYTLLFMNSSMIFLLDRYFFIYTFSFSQSVFSNWLLLYMSSSCTLLKAYFFQSDLVTQCCFLYLWFAFIQAVDSLSMLSSRCMFSNILLIWYLYFYSSWNLWKKTQLIIYVDIITILCMRLQTLNQEILDRYLHPTNAKKKIWIADDILDMMEERRWTEYEVHTNR